MRFIIFTFILGIAFTSTCVHADNPNQLISAPTQFTGNLFYIDYRSGKEVNIPMTFMLYQSADEPENLKRNWIKAQVQN